MQKPTGTPVNPPQVKAKLSRTDSMVHQLQGQVTAAFGAPAPVRPSVPTPVRPSAPAPVRPSAPTPVRPPGAFGAPPPVRAPAPAPAPVPATCPCNIFTDTMRMIHTTASEMPTSYMHVMMTELGHIARKHRMRYDLAEVLKLKDKIAEMAATLPPKKRTLEEDVGEVLLQMKKQK